VSTTAICKKTRRKSRMLLALTLLALGAIAALQQETLPHGDLAQRLLQAARLTCKNQRRKARELPLDGFERGLVGIVGDLLDRPLAPAVARPTLGHVSPPL
jgi:hypothetical protein